MKTQEKIFTEGNKGNKVRNRVPRVSRMLRYLVPTFCVIPLFCFAEITARQDYASDVSQPTVSRRLTFTQASTQKLGWTWTQGTTAKDLTAATLVLFTYTPIDNSWAQCVTGAVDVATNGSVLVTFTAAQLNTNSGAIPFDFMLEVSSSTQRLAYTYGKLTLIPDISAGVTNAFPTSTLPVDWSKITLYSHTADSGPVRPDGTTIGATTNADGSLSLSTITITGSALTNATQTAGAAFGATKSGRIMELTYPSTTVTNLTGDTEIVVAGTGTAKTLSIGSAIARDSEVTSATSGVYAASASGWAASDTSVSQALWTAASSAWGAADVVVSNGVESLMRSQAAMLASNNVFSGAVQYMPTNAVRRLEAYSHSGESEAAITLDGNLRLWPGSGGMMYFSSGSFLGWTNDMTLQNGTLYVPAAIRVGGGGVGTDLVDIYAPISEPIAVAASNAMPGIATNIVRGVETQGLNATNAHTWHEFEIYVPTASIPGRFLRFDGYDFDGYDITNMVCVLATNTANAVSTPLSRTITVNGTAGTLSSNLSWTVSGGTGDLAKAVADITYAPITAGGNTVTGNVSSAAAALTYEPIGTAAASNSSAWSTPYQIAWASSNYLAVGNGNHQAYNVSNTTTLWMPNSTDAPTNSAWAIKVDWIPNGQSVTITNATLGSGFAVTNNTETLFHKGFGDTVWFGDRLL